MLSKLLTIWILASVFAFGAHGQFQPAQTKYLVGLEGFICNGMLFKNESSSYRLSHEKMVKKNLDLRGGMAAYFVKPVRPNINCGMELGYRALHFGVNNALIDRFVGSNGNEQNVIRLRGEPIRVDVYSASFRIEFFKKKANSPIGFYHHINIGYSLLSFSDKSYNLSISESGADGNGTYWSKPAPTHYFHNWPVMNAITIQHGVGIRLPISEHLTLQFGTRSILTFELPKNLKRANYSNVFMDYESFYYDLKRLNLFTFNLNAGICLML